MTRRSVAKWDSTARPRLISQPNGKCGRGGPVRPPTVSPHDSGRSSSRGRPDRKDSAEQAQALRRTSAGLRTTRTANRENESKHCRERERRRRRTRTALRKNRARVLRKERARELSRTRAELRRTSTGPRDQAQARQNATGTAQNGHGLCCRTSTRPAENEQRASVERARVCGEQAREPRRTTTGPAKNEHANRGEQQRDLRRTSTGPVETREQGDTRTRASTAESDNGDDKNETGTAKEPNTRTAKERARELSRTRAGTVRNEKTDLGKNENRDWGEEKCTD
jgi:hypothetical protein